MKSWFRRYWWGVLVGTIVLCFAILVEIFRLQGYWLAERIFGFLSGWAIVLSATVALLLVIVAFMTLRENRRSIALNRIRSWATESVRLITLSNINLESKSVTDEDAFNQLKTNVRAIKNLSWGVLGDAESLGSDMREKVGEAVVNFLGLDMVVDRPDLPLFTDRLEKAMRSLSEVIQLTSKL